MVYLLVFHIIAATSKIMSGWVPICESAHAWRFYSAAPLGNQSPRIMTRYLNQSHYLDMDLTSPCLNLVMLGTKL